MTAYFIPVLFLGIFLAALIKKQKPFDAFVSGAKGAIPFVVNLFPYLAGIFVLTELLEVSGVSAFLTEVLSPVFGAVGIPKELSKLVLIKPFSGSGSLAVLTDIYTAYGVDSYLARAASAIYGSSETVFYVAAVYFAGAKTKKLALPIVISLFASFFSCAAACLICRIM